MQHFLDLFISINCSTCFRRFLRPSSGAENCTYSVRYCQTNTAACCYRGWDRTALAAAIVDEMELHFISSTIAAGSSIGLTIPDAVCTVFCSWWWAEELPETCRAVYRNKQIEKTLHLVGCTFETELTNIYANIKTVSVKQRPKGQKMTESQNSCASGVEGEQGRNTEKLFSNMLAVLNVLLLLTTYLKSWLTSEACPSSK